MTDPIVEEIRTERRIAKLKVRLVVVTLLQTKPEIYSRDIWDAIHAR